MRTKTILLFIIIGSILLISGCIGGPQATPTPEPTAAVTPTGTPVPTPGQIAYMTINGTIRDYQGIPEANAVVTLKQSGKKVDLPGNPQFSKDGKNGDLGSYQFNDVPKGTYEIVAEKGGLKGSFFYSGYGVSDIFLQQAPTVTASVSGPQGKFNVIFTVNRQPNGDIVIKNEGGNDVDWQVSAKFSYVDNEGTTRGPATTGELGLAGDILKPGDSCTIPASKLAPFTHIVVYSTINKPPNPITTQIMTTADL
ncbi:MAG: carboxypeptidase-like regulatory domain-containing protein [Candidatus Doudnabacteria bacterium]